MYEFLWSIAESEIFSFDVDLHSFLKSSVIYVFCENIFDWLKK